MDVQYHPDTNTALFRKARTLTVTYGIYSENVEVPGWWPEDDTDEAGILDAEGHEIKDAAFVRVRDKFINHLREIRRACGASQAAMSAAVGGGPHAWGKWEAGRARPSGTALRVIEMLYRHPERLVEFEEIVSDLRIAEAA